MTRRDGDGQHGLVIALALAVTRTLTLASLGACVSDSSVGTSAQLPAQTGALPPQSGSGAPLAPVSAMATAPLPAATAMTAVPVVPPPSLVAIHGESFGRFGHSNAIVGDLDGDGLKDFVLAGASPMPSALQRVQPAVYIFHGQRMFPASMSVLEADAILRDPSPTAGTLLFAGDADVLQVLGDINGDGFSDFAVLGLGWFRLVLGGAARMHGSLPLAAATPGALVVADAKALPAIYGIGDINRDGFADLLAVDSTATASSRELRAFVIAGRAEAWTPEALRPTQTLAAPFAESTQTLSARAAGDMDGDGWPDMLLEVSGPSGSFALVFYGGASKLAGALTAAQADATLPVNVEPLPDLDGDGRSELTWTEGSLAHVRYGTPDRMSGKAAIVADLTVHAEATAGGGTLRLAVGDLDGDGKRDLIASDPTAAHNGPQSGSVYALRGMAERRTGSVELAAMHIILSGLIPDSSGADQLGYGLCSGGDVSADRIDDALVGAPTSTEGDEAAGTVFLIRGRASPL